MTRLILVGLGALTLAGCATGTDPEKLKKPSAWMMAPICRLPAIPQNDGDPVARAEYETAMRRCAAKRGDQARGLQKYARAVTKN